MATTKDELTAERRFLEAFALLGQSDAALASNDATKAGEKLWAASCQAVIAVSQLHGWPCETHREMKEATVRLSSERDDLRFQSGFAVAEKYIHPHLVPGYQLEGDRPIVRGFVERLVAMATAHTS